MIFVLLAFIVAIGIGYFLKKQFEYRQFTRRGIIGPKPSFLFGNTKSWILGKRNLIYDIDDAYR